jgi:hypothetical protein
VRSQISECLALKLKKTGENMPWDSTTNRLVTKEWLRLASPDVVYQALEDYGQHFVKQSALGDYDQELEMALGARNGRLIDLALARNAATPELVTCLYQRALGGTGDPDYDKAIRLACLANRMTPGMPLFFDSSSIDQSELRRLDFNGDDDELTALLRNPTRRRLLVGVYGRRGASLTSQRTAGLSW